MKVLLLLVLVCLGWTAVLHGLEIQTSFSPDSPVAQRYALTCKAESQQILLRFRLINDGTSAMQVSWDEACKSCMTVQWDVPPPIHPGQAAELLIDIPFPLERPHREVVLVLRGTWEENIHRSWQCTFSLQQQEVLSVYPSVITHTEGPPALVVANMAQAGVHLERIEYLGTRGVESSEGALHLQPLDHVLASGASYRLTLDDLPQWSQVQSLAIHMQLLSGQALAPYMIPVSIRQ